MSGFRASVTGLLVSAALIVSVGAQAMEFQQFDRMAAQDRQAFLDFQSVAAERVLIQEGRSDDAAKVHRLFNDIRPGDDMPLGEAELEGNVDGARVADAKRAIQNPNLPRIQVEAALGVTLKKNGIELTPDFLKGFTQLTGAFHAK